jgi:protein-tyrosine kinase
MARAPIMTSIARLRNAREEPEPQAPPREDGAGANPDTSSVDASPSFAIGADVYRDMPIGQILVESKRLAEFEIARILGESRRENLRFGEAAIRLGLIKLRDIDFALARQFAFPYVSPEDNVISREVIAAYSPSDPTVEMLRSVRSQILVETSQDRTTRIAIAVVSPESGDGRSFVAANLAVLFAQLGRPTLLLDGSFRTARVHRLFDLDSAGGLSTFLAGRTGMECIRSIVEVPGLHVMPAGPVPPNPLELFERARLRGVMPELLRTFEVILVDTSAGFVGGDSSLLARFAGSALVVARLNRIRLAEARTFAAQLERARARVLGVVVNDR